MTDTITAPQPQQTLPILDGRDPRFEAKFREWNLEYRYEPSLPIEDIRVADWAQVRDASLGHVAPDAEVEEYRQHMANGAHFPPVVLMSPDVLIDGNTRRKAALKLRLKTYPAYVVELASLQIAKSLGAALNQLGGKRLTADEASAAAETLMSMNFNDEAIAREIGRSVEQVRYLRNQKEFAERSRKLKIEHQADQVAKDTRARLNSIKHDPPFAAFTEFVAEVQPPKKTVTELLKAVQAAPSDADAITLITQQKRELRPAGPPPQRPTVNPAVGQANMNLNALLKYEDPTVFLETRPDRREQAIANWQRVGQLSQRVLELYGATA